VSAWGRFLLLRCAFAGAGAVIPVGRQGPGRVMVRVGWSFSSWEGGVVLAAEVALAAAAAAAPVSSLSHPENCTVHSSTAASV
jgi:hypothetical protein